MSHVASAVVHARRTLVQRPWIYWLIVTLAAFGAAASMFERSARVDAARASWGATRTVLVATSPHAPGDPLEAETREVPGAVVADGAIDRGDGLVARQHIGAGEIIHDIDVVAVGGPQAMIPAGWLAVPIAESPPSGAALGDRVQVVSDGFAISLDGGVVGEHDGVTLVAVPAGEAPLIALAADSGNLTLLLKP